MPNKKSQTDESVASEVVVTHNVIVDNEDGTRTIKPVSVPEGEDVSEFLAEESKNKEEQK